MSPADALATFKVDAVKLRQEVTALVERERAKDAALRELADAVLELLELAPRGSHARHLADNVLDAALARARRLIAA